MADGRLDDDRLAVVLASVGAHLVVDDAATSPVGAPGASDRRGWRRPLLVAAVALAVLAGAIVAVAPARRVVSGWFGIGRIDVQLDRAADPTGLPSFEEPAEPIGAAAVDEVLGRSMPAIDGSELGAPSGWWTLPEGGVLASWPSADTSLWVVASSGDVLLKKVLPMADDVIELGDLGDGGVAVSGEHLLQTPHRRVSADNAVIWMEGALTFRLDGTADLDELIRIARQLADPGASSN